MIAAVLLLLLTGVLAFICAAIVGWQIIAVGALLVLTWKFLKKFVFKRE